MPEIRNHRDHTIETQGKQIKKLNKDLEEAKEHVDKLKTDNRKTVE